MEKSLSYEEFINLIETKRRRIEALEQISIDNLNGTKVVNIGTEHSP